MPTLYPSNDHTPSGMSTSLRRTGSVTRSRSGMTPSVASKRGSAFLNASSTTLEFGSISPGVEGDLMNETAGLKKVVEGLNKTNTSLRNRITDLEKLIEHNTGPEVERLNKELAMLEDLFAKSQKDNEAQYAESERQKAYVKELENLLTTSLGMDWQESHNIYPPAPTTAIVTSSTPLPPPKPTHPLRHSVSFSSKRSSSKLHKRANSVMDLDLMSLQAVKEDDMGVDDTPSGALRKLSGSTSAKANENEDKNKEKRRHLLSHTPEPKLSTLTTSQKNLRSPSTSKPKDQSNVDAVHTVIRLQQPDGANTNRSGPTSIPPEVDIKQLNKVLHLLSSLDPTTIINGLPRAQSQSPGAQASLHSTHSSQERDMFNSMCRMLESQQQILSDRETRLNSIIQMAKEKEERYAMTT
ncbi:hypothetical protein I203_100888 [Kwoniella mangroviensis CBS 8507]|uniref:uncharacterized protein n=1 Tax=Kwoniella mangroviensis CBS 8507 TaxID=1296122 RepID=UPI00080CD81F|nr:uncharacterized protein I203_02528 [Kwoniella mangroviensis CBS 8507]OCF67870.1 hypothetical protein I203_02528 [Kwoniella mangroviensis CBS 8507]